MDEHTEYGRVDLSKPRTQLDDKKLRQVPQLVQFDGQKVLGSFITSSQVK